VEFFVFTIPSGTDRRCHLMGTGRVEPGLPRQDFEGEACVEAPRHVGLCGKWGHKGLPHGRPLGYLANGPV
jgi:hypothetical protein